MLLKGQRFMGYCERIIDLFKPVCFSTIQSELLSINAAPPAFLKPIYFVRVQRGSKGLGSNFAKFRIKKLAVRLFLFSYQKTKRT